MSLTIRIIGALTLALFAATTHAQTANIESVAPQSGGTVWYANWGSGPFASAAAACSSGWDGSRFAGTVPNSGGYAYLGYLDCTFTNPATGKIYVSGTAIPHSDAVCPTPTVNPAVPYQYNLATGMCERPAQSTLTITLSPGSSIEPWHKKHDLNHLQANLPFVVYVADANKAPKAGVAVRVTVDVTANSGGHDHNDNRPQGRLIASSADPTPVSTVDGKTTLDGVTDSMGNFWFDFGAEEASGTHTLNATCGGCSNNPQTATVKVEIPGLMQLDADPLGYTLTGDRPEHPDNHYFSPAATVKIINLTLAYQRKFHHPLIINDSSLVKGGVFDIEKDWTYKSNKHGGHRVGVVVDINNYTINPTPPREQFPSPRFVDFAATFGIQADPHPGPGHPMGTAPHYHLLLLGAGHDQ